MAAGRVAGALAERPSGFFPVGAYLVIELAAAAALLASL